MKCLIFTLFLGCSSNHIDSKVVAEKAATLWFDYLDKGFFEKVFLESSPYLRDRLNKSKLKEMFTKRLMLVGKNKGRTKTSLEALEKYRGLGNGEFIAIDFLTDFELQSSVKERVVLKREGQKWRVFDYFFF